jgi:peroxiredoxin
MSPSGGIAGIHVKLAPQLYDMGSVVTPQLPATFVPACGKMPAYASETNLFITQGVWAAAARHCIYLYAR